MILTLLLTRQLQTRRQVARTLYSAGLELRFCETAQECQAILARERPRLLILDADTIEADALRDALGQWTQGSGPSRPVIILSLGADKAPLMELLRRYEVANLVAKQGAIRAVYPVVDERELLVTAQKILQRDIFGLEKYVGAWGVAIHRHPLRSMKDKYRLATEFEGFLTDLEVPPAVVPDMVTVADELMVNAIVHAPRSADGVPRYEHRGPDPEIVLEPSEYAEVSWACDGQRLMFGVADPFGALEREVVNAYLAKGFSRERQTVEKKSGGAGLGLAMTLKRVHQLVFNVRERERTEVLAGWSLRAESAGEFRQVSRSLNIFWLGAEVATTRENPVPSGVLQRPPPLPGAVRNRPTGDAHAPPASRPTPPQTLAASAPRASSSDLVPPRAGRGIVERRLKGWINERAELLPEGESMRLDLRWVIGFTSGGILRWVDFVERLAGRPTEILGAPEAFVRAAAEVEGFVGPMQVRTVLAPYECSRCGISTQLERKLARVLKTTQHPCNACGGPLLFVGVEHEYAALQELLGVAPENG